MIYESNFAIEPVFGKTKDERRRQKSENVKQTFSLGRTNLIWVSWRRHGSDHFGFPRRFCEAAEIRRDDPWDNL